MTHPCGGRRSRWLRAGALAIVALLGSRARADLAQADLAVDPGVTVPGNTVNVNLTVTDTGTFAYNTVSVTLLITSGASLVQFLSGPYFGGSTNIAPGDSQVFTWTFSVVGTGTVGFSGQSDGYVQSQEVHLVATAVLSIPPPAPPAIQILGNVLRPGQVATIVVHGNVPGGTVTLTLYDQGGAPLGRVGDGPVAVDGNGFGSVRFDGSIRGRRLSAGAYWIAASGGASSKAPILILAR